MARDTRTASSARSGIGDSGEGNPSPTGGAHRVGRAAAGGADVVSGSTGGAGCWRGHIGQAVVAGCAGRNGVGRGTGAIITRRTSGTHRVGRRNAR